MKVCNCRPNAGMVEFSFAEHVFIVDKLTCSQNLWTLGKEGGAEHWDWVQRLLGVWCVAKRFRIIMAVTCFFSYFLEGTGSKSKIQV